MAFYPAGLPDILAHAPGGIARDGFYEFLWTDLSEHARRVYEGFDRLIAANEAGKPALRFPRDSYARDEIGEELEAGLLEKKVGQLKAAPTAAEIAEGRLGADPNKHRFHYSNDLKLRVLGTPEADEYRSFLASCELMNDAALVIAKIVAMYVDAARPDLALTERINAGKVITRILRYDHAPNAPFHAKAHRDRSCLTVHWDSSHPGLELFTRSRVWRAANETDPERLLVFPGLKFWSATRGEYGTGTIHRVRRLPRENAGAEAVERRFALVSFVHCAMTPDDVRWHHEHIRELAKDYPTDAAY